MVRVKMRPVWGITCAVMAAMPVWLSACGGGGSSSSSGSSSPTTVSGATANAQSSGAITAFGSVFVNGHEFATDHVNVVDDDTGAQSSGTAALEVGMTVDVKAAEGSTSAHPVASDIHVHALARGAVDALDSTAGTLRVMGQRVLTTAATVIVDRRACVTATTSPCTAKASLADLSVISTSGTPTPGSYVGVHGYLFSDSTTDAVATLLVIGDAPTDGTTPAAYKAEGAVTVHSGSHVTIGLLDVDLGAATCRVEGAPQPCATAFAVGDIVSAFSSSAPATSPVSAFAATSARLAKRLSVQTAGATIELEGRVSAASSGHLVVRGLNIDTSGLGSSFTLPSVGDEVRVVGTWSSDGTTVTATSVTLEHAARAVSVDYETTLQTADISAGATAGAFNLRVLGQTVIVNATTRLADHAVSHSRESSHPFNIDTFQTYLAASPSQHVLIRASVDTTSGSVIARAVTLIPTRNVFAIAGRVDATPAPVNAATTTFAVRGVAVSAAAAAVLNGRHGSTTTVQAGDLVLVRGTWDGSTLNVAAPTGSTPNELQIVIDTGTPERDDSDLI